MIGPSVPDWPRPTLLDCTLLQDRLRTSAFLITVVVALIVLDAKYSLPGAEGLWLLPLLLFFSLGTTWDIVSMIESVSLKKSTAMIAVGIVTLSATVPTLWPLMGHPYPTACPVGSLGWIVLGAIAAMFLIVFREMKAFDSSNQGAVHRVGLGGFLVASVGLPFALMVALRSLGEGNWGMAALLTMIATTKSADAGAYFAGKKYGKHKLIPRLSPGKTWEGLLGGVVTATIVAFVCLQFLFPAVAGDAVGPVARGSLSSVNHPIVGALLLGPLLAIAGLFGDLAESMIKRDCDAKDSGSWLPGLGGVWDVTDSLVAAVFPAYLCFVSGIGGQPLG